MIGLGRIDWPWWRAAQCDSYISRLVWSICVMYVQCVMCTVCNVMRPNDCGMCPGPRVSPHVSAPSPLLLHIAQHLTLSTHHVTTFLVFRNPNMTMPLGIGILAFFRHIFLSGLYYSAIKSKRTWDCLIFFITGRQNKYPLDWDSSMLKCLTCLVLFT